jgi:His-Xaa-Ser system radical SAM maturase HxsC
MRMSKGIGVALESTVVGAVTRNAFNWRRRSNLIYVRQQGDIRSFGHTATVTSLGAAKAHVPGIYQVDPHSLGLFDEGDVVALDPDGSVRRLWRSRSRENVILVTNACNCQCLMCPQPSGPDPERWDEQNFLTLQLANSTSVGDICFTGGEPTLRMESLCSMLAVCRQRFPDARVYILTNGRKYKDFENVKSLVDVGHKNMMHCVSLGGDTQDLHDCIMGVAGGFSDTIAGLHNLARLRQSIEIRVVVMKQNFARLPQISEFIYRNFPFAAHVTFMGLETTGLAVSNVDLVWVDPIDFGERLAEAVQHLHRRNMNVSVYNLPYCLLPERTWPFARDSISDWKKTYLPVCDGCVKRAECSGVFATSELVSEKISPIC